MEAFLNQLSCLEYNIFFQIFTSLIFSNVLILVVEHFLQNAPWVKFELKQPLVRWKVIYCG